MGLFTGNDDSLKELCKDNVSEEIADESLFDRGLIPEGIKSSALDLYDKTGFKDVLGSGYNSILDTLKEIGSYNTNLGGLVSRPRGDDPIEPGVTGLYHYGTPNATQYKECFDVDGLSVWDTRGWWRCLFPQQVIESRLGQTRDTSKVIEKILTKEKVEKDKSNKYGLFFPDWSLYMKWRVYMNQLMEERKEKEISNRKNNDLKDWAYDFYQDKDKTPEDIMMNRSLEGLDDDKPQVIGKSEYVTMQSTPDGKEEVKQLKTYFSNGTTSIESIKKVYPKDGGKPTVERTVRTVPSSDKGRKF